MLLTRRNFIKTGLLASGLVVADALWLEKFFIEIKRHYIGKATKKTENLQVMQLSDLHLKSVNYQLRQLAGSINKMKPDLILITGDAIDDSGKINELITFLNLINKDIQKAAILGNWEHWGKVDLTELEKVYNDNNCVLLMNRTTQFKLRNKTVSVTGVDDLIGGTADIELAVKGFQQSDYHIVMNHCPEYSDTIAEKLKDRIKTDFILSGHTHGGQFNFFGFAPFLPRGSGRYVRGWYKDDLKNLYVSKGIGTSIYPARFGARAEVAVFNLET